MRGYAIGWKRANLSGWASSRRGRLAGGCAAAIAALLSLAVLAQEAPSPVGKRIVEVRVVGTRQVSQHEVFGQIQTKAGQVYSREAIQDDVRNIYSLGRFDSVEPQVEVAAEGVVLTFQVKERAKIEALEFRGSRSLKSADVHAAAGLSAGDFLDRTKLALARQKVLELYQEKGYYFADVTLDEQALPRGRVLFQIREGPKVRVRKVAYRGNETVPAADLNRQVETRRYRLVFASGTLDEKMVKADVVRIQQYYRDQGYLDVQVGHQLDFSDDRKDVTVVYLIHEGPRYKVGEVRFQGNRLIQVYELRNVMLLQPGQPFMASSVQHDVKAIKDEVYGRQGYIDAQVEIKHAYADDPNVVNLAVNVAEGTRSTIGRIDIAGNDVTQGRVIRHYLTFFPEQPHNVLAEQESRSKLLNTGMFKDVKITAREAAGQDEYRDVLVMVEEARTTMFMIGVGISSDQGLLGNVTVENRNFDLFGWPKTWAQMFTGKAFKGAGQTLRLVLEPGTELNQFQLQFYEPFLLDKPIGLGTNLYYRTRPREAYDESRIGYVVSLGKRLRKDWSVEGALRVEGVNISGVDENTAQDIMDAEGSHALIAGKFTLARDTTDNRFLPTRGSRLSLSAEPAGGTDTFVRLYGDYRSYRTVRTDVYDRKSTVSTRLGLGYIPGNAPIYERFYAGGISTMRGFKYRGVGPHDGPDDDPIGGHFEFLAGAEYAFPLWGKSQGAFFLDSGTVTETPAITPYRVAVGFEVRIPLEFGEIKFPVPLTFGVAAPILKDGDDDTQWFHFLFGTSF